MHLQLLQHEASSSWQHEQQQQQVLTWITTTKGSKRRFSRSVLVNSSCFYLWVLHGELAFLLSYGSPISGSTCTLKGKGVGL